MTPIIGQKISPGMSLYKNSVAKNPVYKEQLLQEISRPQARLHFASTFIALLLVIFTGSNVSQLPAAVRIVERINPTKSMIKRHRPNASSFGDEPDL